MIGYQSINQGIVYCSSVQKHLTVFENIRTAGGVVCYLVNIIKQKAGKEVRVCEVTRVVGQVSIVCSRSQVVVS